MCPGTAEGDFKKWFYNHRKSFYNEAGANNTNLSKYMWELKKIKFKPNSSMVHCLKSTTIFKYTQEVSSMLSQKTWNNYLWPDELPNKRSELMSKCCHANKVLSC